MKRIVAAMCAAVIVGFFGVAARAQEKKAEAPKPSAGIAADLLKQWNRTGKKLADMAQDFPENKLDYKATPAERTFAEQLLHAAGANYYFIEAARGKEAPDGVESPSRETYKTRGQIVAFIQKTYAEGAAVIQEQGDKGMLEAVKSPFANVMMTRAALWTSAIGHANDHYGQCVVYYRLNGLVPPESRNQQ